MKIESYGSVEDMLAAVQDARGVADQAVLPFQAEAKYGDCYVRLQFDDQLVIYGELLDPTADCAPDEIEEVINLYAQRHMKHYRFGRHYSVCCEDGELGDVHVSSIAALLSREAFESARALGWPEGVAGAAWNKSRKEPNPIVAFKTFIEAALLSLRRTQQSFTARSS